MELVRRIVPFLIALLIGLVIITYVPAISMTIPRLPGIKCYNEQKTLKLKHI